MFAFVLAGIIAVISIMFNRSPHFSTDAKIGSSILCGVLLVILVTVGCISEAKAATYPYLPNKQLTPGSAASTNLAEICQRHYTVKARHVSESLKRRVYQQYNVNKLTCAGGCKIDHLIPLAIGGSNNIDNLWPHEYSSPWTVYAKTRLEVRLRKEVCSNNLNIIEAQTCISSDWTKCFARFYPGDYK